MPNLCSLKKNASIAFWWQPGTSERSRKCKMVFNSIWLLWKKPSLLILCILNFWQPRPILRESELLNFLYFVVNVWNYFGFIEKKDKHHSWKKPIKICCGVMEYASLLEGFLEELYWGNLALLMFAQHTDLRQEGSSYPWEMTSSFMWSPIISQRTAEFCRTSIMMPAQELMDITCLKMEDDLDTSRHQQQGILCLLWEDTILALPL